MSKGETIKSRKKICVVVTARPSYSRIKTALIAIDRHPHLDLQLVIAGSALLDRYGNAVDFIEKDGFKIAEKVFMVLEGANPTAMAKTTGLGVLELSNVFYNLQPDAVVTIADRFETIATSIAAAYQNIPLIHIQGGEVTGNIDEKTRHANTKFADLHLVSNDQARNRVIKLGEYPSSVFNTGCPSIDLAAAVRKKLSKRDSLTFDPLKKYGGVGADVDFSKDFIVVMQHPVTNEYKAAKQQVTQLLEVVHEMELQCFWFWPNVDSGADATSNGIRSFRERLQPKNIHFFKNMEPSDFLELLYFSNCLIGNSSAGIRECSYLGVPVVNIGSRQHNRLRGSNVIDVPHDHKAIRTAIENSINHGRYESQSLYGTGDAGVKIADVIANHELTFSKTINY